MAKSELYWRGVQGLRMWIGDASARLGAAGIAAPRFDAERLAAHVLGVTWSELVQNFDSALDDPTFRALEDVLTRRANGEPLAYIEGVRGFYGLDLRCGPGVLVPRPDTETLVDVALELIDGVANPIVVDIGTGTGAIALAIAAQRPDAEVVATDVSEDALRYARDNGEALGLDAWFACGDLFDAVPDALRGRVDVLVSNPPYVREGTELPADVRAEPSLALFAGPDGTDVLHRIVDGAPAWVKTGGAIALEIGDASQASVLPGGTIRNDLGGRPRVVWTRR